jgi:signal transduction histidine kinase
MQTSHPHALLRVIRLTMWIVPLLMAALGVSYVLIENQRHSDNPGWPVLAGILVLGLAGPGLAWLCLGWAYRTATAYLESQQELSRRMEERSTLNALVIAASQSIDLQETLATVLERCTLALNAGAGMIFLRETGQEPMRLVAYRGISPEAAEREVQLRPGNCLCGQALESRQLKFANNIRKEGHCAFELCACEGLLSVTSIPLEVKGEVVGLLQLASPEADHFNAAQHEFLTAVAAQVGVSIENARLHHETQTFNQELEAKVHQRTAELQATQQALVEKASQLQRLLNAAYQIQDDTQARIAQDMHDSVIQMIIGALYETQAARQSLVSNPERATASLEQAQCLLSEVETEIRRTIYDLHPPMLDTQGLVVALKHFAGNCSHTFDLQCQVKTFGRPQRLPKDVEIAIYRIVQAALHNVAAHAQAKHAQVKLDFGSDAFQASIEDDGIGFDPRPIFRAPGEHLGLIGMQERAQAIGANLNVISNPNEGTRVLLELLSPTYL